MEGVGDRSGQVSSVEKHNPQKEESEVTFSRAVLIASFILRLCSRCCFIQRILSLETTEPGGAAGAAAPGAGGEVPAASTGALAAAAAAPSAAAPSRTESNFLALNGQANLSTSRWNLNIVICAPPVQLQVQTA